MSLFECLSITVSSSCSSYMCARGMTDRTGVRSARTTPRPPPSSSSTLLCPAIEKQQKHLFEVSPFCLLHTNCTYSIYIFTYIVNVWEKRKTNKKESHQTVIPSSDGMLNASTDSVHEQTVHTHAHVHTNRHAHVPPPPFTHDNTCYTNAHTLNL